MSPIIHGLKAFKIPFSIGVFTSEHGTTSGIQVPYGSPVDLLESFSTSIIFLGEGAACVLSPVYAYQPKVILDPVENVIDAISKNYSRKTGVLSCKILSSLHVLP